MMALFIACHFYYKYALNCFMRSDFFCHKNVMCNFDFL